MKKFIYLPFLFTFSLAMAHENGHVEYQEQKEESFGRLILAASSGKIKNRVTIKKDQSYVYIETNSIPDHSVNSRGPNSMQETSKSYRVPVSPKTNDQPTQSNPNSFGVALNGVPFRPSTAEYWNNNRDWVEEAISSRGKRLLGLDNNYGHVDHSGLYHYHGTPTDFIKTQQKTTRQRMALVGYAADGFPIYSEYGYRSAKNSRSGLTKLKSSYQLKKGKRPSDGPSGRYDGTYANDYEYVEDSGDLDECNGRFGVTPDYPKGTYYYVITKSFPFVSRFWKGTPDDSFLDRRGGRNNGQGNQQERRGGQEGRDQGRENQEGRGQGRGGREQGDDRRQGPPGQRGDSDFRPPHPPPHHRDRKEQKEIEIL
ncbi:hypothetical protein LNTAR_02122 [Lentisphaera araneosa HTCC2155]|uniref:YHYH domain-containing protein n=1 Tax=Lentisphaera araneosa HTCC2155 TaxID=313628 RepID=A6DP34_9BACT|nr:YHYH protein [Lentisphaera araneosa]EDM26566.1 hypothetical protein LNTAR_02122 [Lentisphaera araneosa HTCC2155]